MKLKALGPAYIQQAFVWAHEADPQAKLFYNDYNDEALGPKSDAVYNLLRHLKARGVPIDGIGLQSHFLVEHPPDFNDIAVNLKRLAALGLEIHVTELDASMPMPPNKEHLQQQAKIYRYYLNECLSISNCKAFVMWGFTDKYSWIPKYMPGEGAALPFGKTYSPKPAYFALFDTLSKDIQWHSLLTIKSDSVLGLFKSLISGEHGPNAKALASLNYSRIVHRTLSNSSAE